MVAVRKIPADCTSLSYEIEESLTELPASPKFKLVDPNSYTGEFGANVEYMVEKTIGSGRAPKKGEPVGKTVPAGFEQSVRQDWIQPFLPGFFFNDPIETPNTNAFRSSPKNPPVVPSKLASVSATKFVGTNFTEANGWKILDTPLVVGSGFANDANNGLHKITAITATELTAAGLAAESSVDDASIEVCGVEVSAASAKSNISISGNEITIIASQLGTGKTLTPALGSFVHIGGDGDGTKYAGAGKSNTGWARVVRTVPNGIVCDLTTFTPSVVTGNNNNVQIFLPTRVFRDQITCDDKFRTTYQLERRLGHADTTYPHEQSQLVTGAVANQIDFAMPTKSKVMATLNFICAESYRRTGATNLLAPWSGTRKPMSRKNSLVNMSTDLKYGIIYRHDASKFMPNSIFGLVLDGTLSLNNNCAPIEGWGVYGAYDINTGELDIQANLTALFTNVSALDLAEEGVDAGLFVVFAHDNQGFILDCPLMTVQASPLQVTANEPVKISLTNSVNESDFGYAASLQFFDYLPTEATARKVS